MLIALTLIVMTLVLVGYFKFYLPSKNTQETKPQLLVEVDPVKTTSVKKTRKPRAKKVKE